MPQASGEVGSIPDCRGLLRRAGADEIADNDKTAGDPDARTQSTGRAGRARETASRADDCKPRADRALRVGFVRLGIAEIRKNAIAHIASDKALELLDRARDGIVESGNDVSQILRIQPPAKHRRPDQVDKHDG